MTGKYHTTHDVTMHDYMFGVYTTVYDGNAIKVLHGNNRERQCVFTSGWDTDFREVWC